MSLYRKIKLIIMSYILLFTVSSFAKDSFKISAVRKSKGEACSSAMGEARRKVLATCKKADKVLNYKTYETPRICKWQTVPNKKGGDAEHKATIKVSFECIVKS